MVLVNELFALLRRAWPYFLPGWLYLPYLWYVAPLLPIPKSNDLLLGMALHGPILVSGAVAAIPLRRG